MFYIKLDNSMDLVITSRETIYRGDHLNQKLTFLIPQKVGDIDISAAAVYVSYIRADGTADIDLLNRQEELYNETYYKFTMPVTSKLTRYAGPVTIFLTIYTGPCNAPIISKSGECVLHVQASTNMDNVVTDQHLSLIYSMQKQMEDKIEKAETLLNERIDKTDEVIAAKADNIVFNAEDNTIQLVSTIIIRDEEGNETGLEQIPIGDPIFVSSGAASGIKDMEINKSGELVVIFDNGTEKNLGKVVGNDGAVYIPRIDEHKVLTFTLESNPTGAPDPVDMNPNDEWSEIENNGIDAQGATTSYIWEKM